MLGPSQRATPESQYVWQKITYKSKQCTSLIAAMGGADRDTEKLDTREMEQSED